MDIATVLGLVLGFGLIIGSIAIGGGAMVFVHIPSMGIVIGGTLSAVMVHFSMSQFVGIFTVFLSWVNYREGFRKLCRR